MIDSKSKIDEQRSRIDYNRAIEISLNIIEHCKNMEPWPPDYDDEIAEITEQLWKRKHEAGNDNIR